jgi:hypothetical protein
MEVDRDYDEDDHFKDATESKVVCSTSAGDFVMKLNRVRSLALHTCFFYLLLVMHEDSKNIHRSTSISFLNFIHVN